jgi:fructan beta-fructosidase
MKYLSTILIGVVVVLTLSSSKPEKAYYSEKYRPQFHFTPEKNLQTKPNGLVYYNGEYHMFYQYNPLGNELGMMHWAHTISKNLVHWEHYPVVLNPDNNSSENENCSILSGSAIVDEKNILKKQTGDDKTLLAFYTSENCGQRIAYSTDKGRTWVKYEGNPIITYDEKDDARDPKVIWYEPTQKWIMVLSRKITEDENSKGVSFYSSDDFVHWEWKSHIPGFNESPDLIKMQVSNRPEEIKWVLFDGDGSYIIGNFDGETFTTETAKMKSDNGMNYFATQTWSNIPKEDGRTIQIAWMKDGNYPDMPFNGQMTFPTELTLTKFNFGYKLTRKPIKEIDLLHGKHIKLENKNLIPGIKDNPLKKLKGDCYHIIAEFDVKTADNFGLMIRHGKKDTGTEVLYNVNRQTLSVLGITVPLPLVDNKISMEILVDRASIEIFANGGQVAITNNFTPTEGAEGYILFTNGGELLINRMDIYSMNSAWKNDN